MTDKAESKAAQRKQRSGTVVSISGAKSVVVRVETRRRHPMYEKVMRTHRKYHAHDEAGTVTVGDKVKIEESRPFSKLKRWRVVEIEVAQAAV